MPYATKLRLGLFAGFSADSSGGESIWLGPSDMRVPVNCLDLMKKIK